MFFHRRCLFVQQPNLEAGCHRQCGLLGRILDKIRVRAFAAIRQGNALMYFPEANVLVNRQVDAQSRTPAFKGVVVRIRAASPEPLEMETSVG